jgi:hypothetical protein
MGTFLMNTNSGKDRCDEITWNTWPNDMYVLQQKLWNCLCCVVVLLLFCGESTVVYGV